jgi:hypothetical protein
MAFSMDTDSFLNGFFFEWPINGDYPEEIISDNETNFIGADKEVQRLGKNTIISSTASKAVKWKLNPPYAPHFGGIFE